MGGGAWQSTIHGVAKSRTRLSNFTFTLHLPRNFINWSCKLTLCQKERDGGGGQPPVKSEVRAQSNKVGRLCFLGGRCSRISRETPEGQSRLCVCRASFLTTFATVECLLPAPSTYICIRIWYLSFSF